MELLDQFGCGKQCLARDDFETTKHGIGNRITSSTPCLFVVDLLLKRASYRDAWANRMCELNKPDKDCEEFTLHEMMNLLGGEYAVESSFFDVADIRKIDR